MKRFLSIIVLFLLADIYTSAQMKSVVENDSIPDVLKEYMIYTTSKHFQEPTFPRFMILDKTKNYLFGIGGYVNVLGFYDDKGVNNDMFYVNEIPTEGEIAEGSLFSVNVNRSRLFFKLLGRTKIGMIQAYIEADFAGGYESGFFRLRQAFLDMGSVRIGKSFTTFMDEESINGIDPEGPVNMNVRRVPLIRYTYRFSKSTKLAIAAEYPQSVSSTIPLEDGDHNIAKSIENVFQKYPDIPITLTTKIKQLHLFTGINFRMTKYSKREYIFKPNLALSLKLSGNYIFRETPKNTHKLFFSGTFSYGMSDCIQDFCDMGMNIIVNKENTLAQMLPAFGAQLGYHVKWNSYNEINCVYSLANFLYKTSNEYNLYTFGQYASINYIRQLFKYGKFGVEAVYGRKKTNKNIIGDNIRVYLLLRYDF